MKLEEAIIAAQQEMPWHSVANVFPLMSEDEMKALKEDINEYGLQEPIKFIVSEDDEQLVVDGRNRQLACLMAGVERQYSPLSADEEPEKDELAQRIWSLNFTRRHLTPSQLALAAANMRKFLSATIPEAAEVTGASQRNTERATRVMKQGSPALIQSVEQGVVTLFEAEKIITLDKDEQTKRVTLFKEGKIKSIAKVPSEKPKPETDGEDAWLKAVQKPYDELYGHLTEALRILEDISADVELSKYLPDNRIRVDINAAKNNVYQNYPLYYYGGPDATEDTHPESSGVGFITRFIWESMDADSRQRCIGSADENNLEESTDEAEQPIQF